MDKNYTIKVAFQKEIHLYRGVLSIENLEKYIKNAFKNLPESYNLTYKDEEGDVITVSVQEDLEALIETTQQKQPKIFIIESNSNNQSFEKQQDQDQNQKQGQDQQKFMHGFEKIIPEFQKMVPEFQKMVPEFEKMTKSFMQNMQQQQKQQNVHYGVSCDNCEVFPIVGKRYKCTVCYDFDYCGKCHDSVEHNHEFKLIEKPWNFCQRYEKNKEFNSQQQQQQKKQEQQEQKIEKTEEQQKEQKNEGDNVVVISEVQQNGQEVVVEKIGGEQKKQELKKKYGQVVMAKASKISEILGGEPEIYYGVCDAEEFSKDNADYIVGALLENPAYTDIYSSYK